MDPAPEEPQQVHYHIHHDDGDKKNNNEAADERLFFSVKDTLHSGNIDTNL